MKKIFVVAILFLIGCVNLFAQTEKKTEKPVDNQSENNNNLIQAGGGGVMQVFRKVNLEGSAYLNPDWTVGDVTLLNGFVRKNEKIRYNAMNNEVEVRMGGDSVLAVNDNITQFTQLNIKVANEIQVFRRDFAAYDGNTRKTFFEVLHDGKNKILIRYTKVLQADQTQGEYRTGAKTDRIVLKTKYYFLDESGKMSDFDNSKKAVLAKFESKKSLIEGFVKKNDLSYKEKADLKKIMTFIEEQK